MTRGLAVALACGALAAACPAPVEPTPDAGDDCPSVEPTSLDFGDVPVGATATQTLVFTNPRGRVFSSEPVVSTSTFALTVASFAVDPRSRVAIPVQFAPPDPRTYSGTLTLLRPAPCAPKTVTLSGRGASEFIASQRLDFPPIAVSTDLTRTLAITNLGAAPLDVSLLYNLLSSTGVLHGPLSVQLQPLSTAAVPIRLDALGDGPFDAVITLRGRSRVQVVPVHGMGGVPRLSWSTSALHFETLPVDQPTRGRVFIHNAGQGRAELSLRDVVTDAGLNLEASGRVFDGGVEAVLIPSSEGPRAWRLEFDTNDPLTPVLALDVTGTARRVELCTGPFTVTPNTFDLAPSAVVPLTLQNDGPRDCFVSSVVEGDVPWSVLPPQVVVPAHQTMGVDLHLDGAGQSRIIFEPTGANSFVVQGVAR